jgi:phosphatidylglycerophosphate synthase
MAVKIAHGAISILIPPLSLLAWRVNLALGRESVMSSSRLAARRNRLSLPAMRSPKKEASVQIVCCFKLQFEINLHFGSACVDACFRLALPTKALRGRGEMGGARGANLLGG